MIRVELDGNRYSIEKNGIVTCAFSLYFDDPEIKELNEDVLKNITNKLSEHFDISFDVIKDNLNVETMKYLCSKDEGIIKKTSGSFKVEESTVIVDNIDKLYEGRILEMSDKVETMKHFYSRDVGIIKKTSGSFNVEKSNVVDNIDKSGEVILPGNTNQVISMFDGGVYDVSSESSNPWEYDEKPSNYLPPNTAPANSTYETKTTEEHKLNGNNTDFSDVCDKLDKISNNVTLLETKLDRICNIVTSLEEKLEQSDTSIDKKFKEISRYLTVIKNLI